MQTLQVSTRKKQRSNPSGAHLLVRSRKNGVGRRGKCVCQAEAVLRRRWRQRKFEVVGTFIIQAIET